MLMCLGSNRSSLASLGRATSPLTPMNLVEEFKTKPNEKTSFLLVNCEFLVQAQRNTQRVPNVESFLKVKLKIQNTY